MDIIWQIFFLLAPAGVGNIAPVLGNKIPFIKKWQTPVDFKLKIFNKRLLGESKTWKGLALGAVFGGLTNILIFILISTSSYLSSILEFMNGGLLYLILLGMLLGIFALLGDCLESFIKRQLKIAPGKSLPILDQIDYIIGAYALIFILFDLSLMHYVWGLIIYGLIHPCMSNLGYILKLKKDRF